MSTLRNILLHVPQDAEYHPEGDVWTHTRAVRGALDEAIALLRSSSLARHLPRDFLTLTPSERSLLRAAAWCHDLGKADATRKIDGRWRSPRHERPIHLNPILRKLGKPWTILWQAADFADRKTFAYLITRHMAICDICGPDPRVLHALRSKDPIRLRRAALLLILMTMDRLGCDRESRVEDAALVATATQHHLLTPNALRRGGHPNCWRS